MHHSSHHSDMKTFSGDENHLSPSRESPGKTPFSKRKINKGIVNLEDSVNEILALYKDSPGIQSEIIENLEIYHINVTIARDVKSLKSEEKLTTEFLKYINNLKIKNRKD